MDNSAISFKERIRVLRKENGLTINGLHVRSNISKHALKEWEHGNRFPTCKLIMKLADFFGVSVDYLLCRTDNPEINR